MTGDNPFVPRVLVARLGPDRGRLRGLLAALRGAGMDVIDAGARSGAAQVAAMAVRVGADVIGLTLGGRDHLAVCAALRQALRAAGAPDLPIVATGLVPGSEWPDLADLGVRRVFVPDAPAAEVVRFIEWLVLPKAFVAASPAPA